MSLREINRKRNANDTQKKKLVHSCRISAFASFLEYDVEEDDVECLAKDTCYEFSNKQHKWQSSLQIGHWVKGK